ncbi:MAG: LEA type 2 family protein [Elusimicrobia bacterium]|nr:LEA type 2 family protein [Elusimicrobiota bacterium]
MTKRLLFLTLFSFFFFACASMQENYNMVNCKYDIVSVQPTDYNPDNTISMDVSIAISNLNKAAAAAVKRFEGDLYVNDVDVSALTLKDVRVEAGETKVVKSSLDVPLKNLGKLVGLVSMGSVSVDYKVKGTIYFTTPVGDVPFPVTIYQSKKI